MNHSLIYNSNAYAKELDIKQYDIDNNIDHESSLQTISVQCPTSTEGCLYYLSFLLNPLMNIIHYTAARRSLGQRSVFTSYERFQSIINHIIHMIDHETP